MKLSRRSVLAALAFVAVSSACKKEERCKTCGMRIDPASPWRAEIELDGGAKLSFDTPRCALRAFRSGAHAAKRLRVQDYYDRAWLDAAEVRFVVGGDVVGPMGPDLVPVAPGRVTKFIQDHSADRAYSLDELTAAALEKL
ncbi:MAG: nitrous oxide reductase accessory protein NosL [Myxococcales bacterium]|nr:nitrous oxide reductase accessory protein NosL [Myxococcales bacterium]